MRRQDRQPPKTKKYFRSTKSGAGMTKAGVARYRRENPGSKFSKAQDLNTRIINEKDLLAFLNED